MRATGTDARRGGCGPVTGRGTEAGADRSEGLVGVAVDAVGVGAVEGQAGEELGGHASALAGVVGAAGRARAGAGGLAELGEQLGLAPHVREAARVADVAGQELVVDDERAGVDIADGVDEAHDPPSAAQVQPRQVRVTGLGGEGVEVEERIAGEHVGVVEDPAEHLALLRVGEAQVVVAVDAATRRAQAGDAQLGAVVIGQRLELVELVDVVAGADDRDLEVLEADVAQVPHGLERLGVGALATDGVVDVGGHAVEADLDVEVGQLDQALGGGAVEVGAVGGELHAHAVGDGVLDDLEEVATEHGLATADVHVEDLQRRQLVDQVLGLGGVELVGVAAPRAGQAVHAGQVAGVGELPGEADGGVEALLELLGERWCAGDGGHAVSRIGGTSWRSTTPDSCNDANAVT